MMSSAQLTLAKTKEVSIVKTNNTVIPFVLVIMMTSIHKIIWQRITIRCPAADSLGCRYCGNQGHVGTCQGWCRPQLVSSLGIWTKPDRPVSSFSFSEGSG